MRSDISPAKKYANWDTVLVLEEMEAELDDMCDISLCSNDENDPAPKRQRIIVSMHIHTVYFFQQIVNFLLSTLVCHITVINSD